MYYLIYGILLLASTCKCKEQYVVLTATSDCYKVNDNMTLEAEYKGSKTIDGVIWTVTGGSSSMIILVPACIPFSIPSGFPSGRMSHDCSAAPRYRLTIQTLDSADFNKSWGVYFSELVGSTASGRQQQTVTQCETVNESNTGFPRWAIGLIVLVIGAVAAIIYGVYCQPQCLKDSAKEFDEENHNEEISNCDSLNEEHIPCTNRATIDIRQWNVTTLLNEERIPLTNEKNEETRPRNEFNSLNGERMPSANEIIKYIRQHKGSDPLDEERMPFANEANIDIGQGIGSNPLDGERTPFTNEANKDIEQEIGCNEVKTSSENNSLKTKPQLLKNDTAFFEEEEKEE